MSQDVARYIARYIIKVRGQHNKSSLIDSSGMSYKTIAVAKD